MVAGGGVMEEVGVGCGGRDSEERAERWRTVVVSV